MLAGGRYSLLPHTHTDKPLPASSTCMAIHNHVCIVEPVINTCLTFTRSFHGTTECLEEISLQLILCRSRNIMKSPKTSPPGKKYHITHSHKFLILFQMVLYHFSTLRDYCKIIGGSWEFHCSNFFITKRKIVFICMHHSDSLLWRPSCIILFILMISFQDFMISKKMLKNASIFEGKRQ